MNKNCVKILHYLISLIINLFKMNNKNTKKQYEFKLFCVEKVIPSNKETCLPQPRSGHRIVCDSKNLYSFGGYNPHIHGENENNDEIWIESYPLFQELWRFNFASNKWHRYCNRKTLPKELASNAVIRNGNTLMVYSCVRLVE